MGRDRPSALFGDIRDRFAGPDAERMIWAFERALGRAARRALARLPARRDGLPRGPRTERDAPNGAGTGLPALRLRRGVAGRFAPLLGCRRGTADDARPPNRHLRLRAARTFGEPLALAPHRADVSTGRPATPRDPCFSVRPTASQPSARARSRSPPPGVVVLSHPLRFCRGTTRVLPTAAPRYCAHGVRLLPRPGCQASTRGASVNRLSDGRVFARPAPCSVIRRHLRRLVARTEPRHRAAVAPGGGPTSEL